MPNFSYKAVSSDNQLINGTITAPSASEVNAELSKKNLKPISIREEKTIKSSHSTLPAIDKITFCRYVTTMLSSGLSLNEGISVLKNETKHPVMKQILNDILYNLERGNQLSQSLAMYPKVFDTFFIALVKSGEISGTLEKSFKYLESGIRSEYSINQKIKGAMIYPAVILSAMFGIGGLMLFFIMPQIGKVFLSMTIPIPPITRTIFQFSVTMSLYRLPIIIGVLFLLIGLFLFFKQPLGKKILLTLIKPLPVISNLLQQMDIARFCRIFSTLISSAVPITESLEITLNSLTEPKYRAMSKKVVSEVMQGKTIAGTFREHQAFPPLLIQMIASGEKSGTLDSTLADLATFYEEEVTEAVKKSTELIEPILMLFVGIGVGAMILSIIAPMYSVVGSFQTGR